VVEEELDVLQGVVELDEELDEELDVVQGVVG
jgi:hypothetical protein